MGILRCSRLGLRFLGVDRQWKDFLSKSTLGALERGSVLNSAKHITDHGTTCRMWLSVSGETLNPSTVTKRLDLAPKWTYAKGLPVPPQPNGLSSGRIADFNSWIYQVEVDDKCGLEQHFDSMVRLLTTRRVSDLREFSKVGTVMIEVEITSETGIFIPAKVINLLAQIDGSIDIDLRP
jgi:hypothetical protein